MPNLPPVYYNNEKDSFAYNTARIRWVKIVQDAIDDVAATLKSSSSKHDNAQGTTIFNQLTALKQQIVSDGPVELFPQPYKLKVYEAYNEQIEGQNFTWLTGPWLILESYLYRLINLYFLEQSTWFNYDVFASLKEDSFKSSVDGVTELAIHYFQLSKQLREQNKKLTEEELEILFREFAEISLWGNATDLSLLATATLDDIKSIQGKEARKKSEDKILSNDLDQAWKQLSSDSKRRVDFVLDNTGFELYTDLVFALVLIDAGIADEIVIHTKDIPWMVSDVNLKDFYILLEQLRDEQTFKDHREEINYLINKAEYLNNIGTLKIKTSPFWTTALDFYSISPSETRFGGAELHKELLDSSLVIFKGDMNYRKLTADRRWKPTTTFVEAAGPLSSEGLKILSLRTVKADVLVGLPEGVYEKITEEWATHDENKLGWLASGKYAVISYTNGDN